MTHSLFYKKDIFHFFLQEQRLVFFKPPSGPTCDNGSCEATVEKKNESEKISEQKTQEAITVTQQHLNQLKAELDPSVTAKLLGDKIVTDKQGTWIEDDEGKYTYNAKDIFKDGIFHSLITGNKAETTKKTEKKETQNPKIEEIIQNWKKIEHKATIQMMKKMLSEINALDEDEQKNPEIKKIKTWAKYFINKVGGEKVEVDKEEVKEEVKVEEEKRVGGGGVFHPDEYEGKL